jgi:hypothetical protein
MDEEDSRQASHLGATDYSEDRSNLVPCNRRRDIWGAELNLRAVRFSWILYRELSRDLCSILIEKLLLSLPHPFFRNLRLKRVPLQDA